MARKALSIAHEVSCPSCLSSALTSLAIVDPDVGGTVKALRRSLELVDGIGELLGVAMTSDVLAAALAETDPERAARLLGANEALLQATGLLYRMPGRAAFVDARIPAGRARFGPNRWDDLLEEGRHGLRRLIDVALDT